MGPILYSGLARAVTSSEGNETSVSMVVFRNNLSHGSYRMKGRLARRESMVQEAACFLTTLPLCKDHRFKKAASYLSDIPLNL